MLISKLPPTDPGIFLNCHLLDLTIIFYCHQPIREFCKIVTSGPGNYFLLAGPRKGRSVGDFAEFPEFFLKNRRNPIR